MSRSTKAAGMTLLMAADRRDETWLIGSSAHRRDFTIFGFSPEMRVAQEERESNAQLAGYERMLLNLNFAQPF